MKKYQIVFSAIILFITVTVAAQKPGTNELTSEEVMSMSKTELSKLPLEELMDVMEIMGVSTMEELYDKVMNKGIRSASKKVENAFDAPLSTTVLTREEMETYGVTTFEEALRLVPGVIVREKTNGYYDLHLRGFDNLPPKHMMIFSQNKNTLLMVDGRPVFNYVHGGTLWETLPIGFEDLDRIEVVRGPSSALYGPNAVNGVINLITRDISQSSEHISGTVEAGTLNSYRGEFAFREDIGKGLSVGVSANFQKRDREKEDIYLFPQADSVFIDENYVDMTEGGFYDIHDFDKMKLGPTRRWLKDPRDDINELFEDPGLARQNQAVNGYFRYDPKGDFQFELSGGYQTSHLNGSTLGDSPTSFWGRKSESGYFNLSGNIGSLHLQTNYLGGDRNFHAGNPGFHLDMGQFNASAEYNFQLKSLNLRPGISYQSIFYNDLPYMPQEQKQNAYLNGRKELNTTSMSLRTDYMANEKLRLIAALRADKYTDPDPVYPSWQFAATYRFSDERTIRAVYSRANNSSLLLNTHSDYRWDRSDLEIPPTYLHFKGTADIELMTADMLEIGYRSRPAKTLMIDTEVFYIKSRDFVSLDADYSTLDMETSETYSRIAFRDTPLEATQIGASMDLNWILSEKIVFRAHGNIQRTNLDNYTPYSKLEVIEMQLRTLGEKAYGIQSGMIDPTNPEELAPAYINEEQKLVTEEFPDEMKDDQKHEATPTFYGMAGVVYRPAEKFEFSSFGYYTGQQTFINQNTTVDLDAKLTVNAKAAYKPVKNIEVYLQGHNIFDNNTTEFAFMDPVGAVYMAGLKFHY